MTRLLFLMVSAGAAAAALAQAQADSQRPLACYEGEQNPLAAPQTEQFAFLLGAFDAKLYPWDQETGDWAEAPIREAIWDGEYILDGTAIADYWFGADPAKTPDAGRGVNTRVFNPEAGEWVMTWNTWGSAYEPLVLKAKMIDGVLTMWQVYPEQEEQEEISEFVVHDEDHWTRYTYIVNGEDRAPYFKIDSVRIPCEE